MNDRLAMVGSAAGLPLEVRFDVQRQVFAARPCPTAGERRAHLRALREQLHRDQDLLVDARSKDFRSPAESKMLDLLGSTLAVNPAISKLGRWMRPSRRATTLLFLGNSLRVTYPPKGGAGVIVPWSFPLYLAVGPRAVALAAGSARPTPAMATGCPQMERSARAFSSTRNAEPTQETHA